MASSSSRLLRQELQQSSGPPPAASSFWDGRRAAAASASKVLPGSPLPGYGMNGGRILRYPHHHQHHRLPPFRLPSLNASPTCSIDDLSIDQQQDEDPADIVPAPLYSLSGGVNHQTVDEFHSTGVSSVATPGSSSSTSSGSTSSSAQPWRQSASIANNKKSITSTDSPTSYKKTLQELAALRKQRPMLGSTSDYFSLTSSICSDDGVGFVHPMATSFDYDLDFDTVGDCCPSSSTSTNYYPDYYHQNHQNHQWRFSPTQIDQLRTVAERVLLQNQQGGDGNDEVRIKADLLDSICQQTRELERRNEELRQELEQLHFDTKQFVENKSTTSHHCTDSHDSPSDGGPASEQWRNEKFELIFDDNETDI